MASCASSGSARMTSGWCATSKRAERTSVPLALRHRARVASRRPARHLARHALFLLLSFAAGAAAAADLGKATVRSRIGQPLDVDIEVLALKPGEDKTLGARLASRQAYGKAGLEYNRVLPLLRVTIARRSGRP